MTLTSSPVPGHAASADSFDALAPLRLPPDLRLTPEQFELVCAENREAVLELAADGQLIWMPPVGGETSLQSDWIAFASCTGFRLPDGSVLSPDASLLRRDRWQALSQEQRRSFAPLCPDLVVELASPAVAAGFSEGVEGPRGLTALRQKMAAYQANGARLGWLLIPQGQAVEVWPASGAPQRLGGATVLDAGAEFPRLQLQLAEIWAG